MKRSLLTYLLAAALATPATAVPIQITYADGASEGFNDATLGPQRKACFEAAVGFWANKLAGTVPFIVQATFDPKGGTANSAILGSAGANWVFQNFANAPHGNTWYAGALAYQLSLTDLLQGQAMIVCSFNSDVDNSTVLGAVNWYYGTDGNPAGHIDFYQVVLHEVGHGIGFQSYISNTGQYYNVGGFFQPAVYDQYLCDGPTGSAKTSLSMTVAERNALIRSQSLYFNGPATRAALAGANAKMYAPTSYASGSSVSHTDQATYGNTVNSLMCPSYSNVSHAIGPVPAAIFQDMGWRYVGGFTAQDVRKALQYVAGVQSLSEPEIQRLNVATSGASANRLDLQDAAALARKVSGLSP